jgi:hypothetical protein
MWKYIIFYCMPLFTITTDSIPDVITNKDTCFIYVSYTNRELAFLRYKLLKEDTSPKNDVKIDSVFIKTR